MADYVSSLPIESVATGNAVKVSKDLNANASNNAICIQVTDNAGGVLALIAGGDIYSGTNKGILVVGSDGDNYFPLLTDDAGALQVAVTGSVTVSGSVAVTGVTGIVQVSATEDANTSTNPIFVSVVDAVEGNGVYKYDSTSVGSPGSGNHDYIIPNGKTLRLDKVVCSASGSGKFDVIINIGGVPATVATVFVSSADQNETIDFDGDIEIVGDGTDYIRVVRTNRDKSAMQMYDTILGNLITT